MVTMHLSCTVNEIYSLKDIWVTTLTFWGHVTVGLVICGFLLVVHCNHASILQRYGNMVSQAFLGHDVDLLESRDVICHVTIRLPIWRFP